VLVAVSLPPLVGFALVSNAEPTWITRVGAGTALLIMTGTTLVWAVLVAVLAAGPMADEARSIAALAERGVTPDNDDGLSAARRRVAATLEDRNRQISDLASLIREVPIAQDAPAVAHAMVAGARRVTGDPTWLLAVLRVLDPRDLQPGVYGPDPESSPEPLGEVHGWASTSEGQGMSPAGAWLAAGPWGAFAVVEVAAGDAFRAILFAPWEGRPDPSPAELNLFSLIGQHAATVIEHALLYTRLRVQTDELNRMAAVQTDFLRGITHDLQTPLTSIRALAAELQETGGLPPGAHMDLESIAHQADRLRRMVAQLLAMSRLEVGELTPRQEVFRPRPIIERTWAALRAERSFELLVEGPPQLVVGDPDRLEQVLWAVLDNAVKYSHPGSTVRVRVTAAGAGARREQPMAEIAVSDEGIGMDGTTRRRAFEQFYRSPDARSLATDGSGIGLYAAHGLVTAMGGQIRLASRPGEGSTVVVTLPAEAADEADEADETGEAAGANAEAVLGQEQTVP